MQKCKAGLFAYNVSENLQGPLSILLWIAEYVCMCCNHCLWLGETNKLTILVDYYSGSLHIVCKRCDNYIWCAELSKTTGVNQLNGDDKMTYE